MLLGATLLIIGWPAGPGHLAASEMIKLPRDDLEQIVKRASMAQAYVFRGEGVLGPGQRSVGASRTTAGNVLGNDRLQRLREAMFSSRSYEGAAGLQKSCPFDPRVGFRFGERAGEAWLLVSATCHTAILVGRNDDWRRVKTLNLTADALREFIQLAGN